MNKVIDKIPPRVQRELTAGFIGLFVCLLAILIFEDHRIEAMKAFFLTPLSSIEEIGALLSYLTPMVFVALATTIIFQCRRYSLSMIGSFMLSASLVTGFLLRGDEQPGWYLIPAALLISIVVGAGVAGIPAVLSIRRRVNITLSSLVLDYLILQLTSFILQNYMRDPSLGQTASFEIPQRLFLLEILPGTGIRLGFLFAAAAVALLYLLLYRGRLGYEIRSVGASESLAGYVGLSYGKTVLKAQLLAGALAGFGGAVEMMGIQPRYVWDGSFPTVALLGILAAVVVEYHPLWIPVCCLFFGYLWRGGMALNAYSGFPKEVALFAAAITALVLFALRDLEVFRLIVDRFQKIGCDLKGASRSKTEKASVPSAGEPVSKELKPEAKPRKRRNQPSKGKQQKTHSAPESAKTDAKMPQRESQPMSDPLEKAELESQQNAADYHDGGEEGSEK